MGRRSDHSREELTEMALAAGRALVFEGGPSALTARNIAKAIGYAPGTLYNLFNNLDDLARRINADTLSDLATALAATAKKEKDPSRRLHAWARAYLKFCREAGPLWALVLSQPLDDSDDSPDWYKALVDSLFTPVDGALGELAPAWGAEETRRASLALWAAMQGLSALDANGRLVYLSDDRAEDLAKHLVETYLAGLARH